jgi:translation initiation factor IF-2
MPTKTTTKTAARKTATARKPVKAAAVESKRKETKSVKVEAPEKTKSSAVPAPTKAKSHTEAARKSHAAVTLKSRVETPAKPAETPKAAETVKPPKPAMETVSLIDEKKPRPKRAEGDATKTRSFLPPISRIRATPEPPTPPAVVAPPPAPPVQPEAPVAAAEPVMAEPEVEPQKIIHIKPPIIVKELASQLGLKPHQLIAELMALNIFANVNQTVEPDIATQICQKHGFVFEMERREKGGGVHKVEQVVVAPPPPVMAKEEELKTRGPIITFMGHVDHGKTSLMDAIRKTRVAAGEAGGITQHIGAYTVDYKGTRITFLDTPGHAAFTAMRARGAHVTDIVVLVVAADDGLMPQTIEAINHAKAAPHVKIMVALNKIDLPGANIDRVKKQLQERELSPEDWGGETIVVPVSATKGIGIDQLLENMAVQAEVMDLKASPTATPRGTVIEAQVESGRGPTATVIVQMGTLKIGDPFICGDYGGKVKSLMDDNGKPIKEAGPSTPVKVLGFSGLPQAGDEFLVMESERSAKTLSEERLVDRRADKLSAPQRATLESLLEAADGMKHLRIVLKCDAQGSLEALTGAKSFTPGWDRFPNPTSCLPAPRTRLSSGSTLRSKAWP